MFAKVALISALASSAFATVFVTSPTASSTFNGGTQATVSWIDQNGAPTLADWGNADIFIYTGNAKQQTMLQSIATKVNMASTSSVQFTPDPSIGPNGNNYFIRIQSETLMDATQTQYPQMTFSAQYTMTGMTGTFNATIQAQIDGQSTAPIGGSTAASGSATASSGASTTAKVAAASATSASASKNATGTAAGASSTSKSNGGVAMGSVNVWFGALAGVVVLALAL